MPFFHDETNVEWPEDGSEPPPPRADQFMYMTAAEYRGEPAAAQAARFFVLPFSPTTEPGPTSPEEPAKPVQVERGGILNRLFGSSRSEDKQLRRKQLEDDRHQRILVREQRTQLLFSVMVPALRSLGARRAYCRYDGGNDEGFSWLDQYETQAGEWIDTDVLVKRLYEAGVHDQLCAAGFKDIMPGVSTDERISDVKRFACEWLIDEWAWVLLRGHGTGEYSMYGAFTVGLDEYSVTDDSNARPIVQNITIAT